ncbi:hypothetical protein DJ021_12805 [Phenylobacterium hankyongense]|uniref:Calcium-binding protein n=1 Tax=Phenylobacterium hankyongense TaxID=1813876 RepID=A0A328B451_9CAUL|nr:calcium-binding protein [Phenylobacterium hankyongense]RAK60624.1 hypothetical protein DJ021_12805 [Phenylobacterium hankyongense]
MTTYAFETITPEQALNIRSGDYLTFARGPASQVSVAYVPESLPLPARIEVTFQGRTVAFGEELSDLSVRGGVDVADHSRLKIGGEGREVLTGFDGSDGLYGGAGDDTLNGFDGGDLLHGNSGNDLLNGGAGANTIYGGKGDDVINVSAFRETAGSWAHGNQGDDEIVGGAGNDTLYGGQGNDFIGGKEGDDYISGDLGDDEIHAGAGNDTVSGGAGNDTLYSNDGSDLLRGGDGHDMLVIYGPGASLAEGGDGNDTLVSASAEQSVLYGGAGRDQFEFASSAAPGQGFDDLIVDWESGDRLHFAEVSAYSILPRSYSEFVTDSYEHALAIANEHISAAGAHYVAAQVGDDVLVFADTDGNPADGADVAIMLVGRALADIGLENFI